MDNLSVCRTCLRSATKYHLHPIFKLGDDYENVSAYMYEGTGVQIKHDDNLPQKMCKICINKLQNALNFRKKCKEVQSELLEINLDAVPLETDFGSTDVDENIPLVNVKLNTFQTKDINEDSNYKTMKTEFVDTLNIKHDPDIDDDQPLQSFIDTSLPLESNLGNITVNTISLKANFKGNGTKNKNSLLKINNIATVAVNESNFETVTLQNLKKELKEDLVIVENEDSPITDGHATEKLTNDSDKPHKNTDYKNTNTDDSYQEGLQQDRIETPDTILNAEKKSSQVACKFCEKVLSIKSIVGHVKRIHPGADDRRIPCPYCEKCIMRERMNRHVMMMHYVVDGFRCRYCKTEFDSRETLVEHVATCTVKKKRKTHESGRVLAECDICNKKMQKASLRMHKASKHSGLKPVCEHCGNTFGNKFRLNEHYRAKHGYEKFQCSYCDFQSAGITAMRNHERRHRGEKPFVCETCGAKFHASYLLNQHKNSHRTEKLVKCELCPASFKANNSLHMHKLTCHSDCMYRCTICARAYKCRHYALKHVRLAHSHRGPPPVVKVTE